VRSTGEIGLFLITGERGVASGVRRIEAITGRGALEWLGRREELLSELVEEVGVPAERLAAEVRALKGRLREEQRETARLRRALVAGSSDRGGPEEREVRGVTVVAKEVPPAPPEELRGLADTLRDRLGSGVVVLGARAGGKVSLVAAVSADLTERLHAGRLIKELAGMVGGGGGGRASFAQAGGKRPDMLPQALEAAEEQVAAQLAEAGSLGTDRDS
jgi:alanyl-tRNA synthetase